MSNVVAIITKRYNKVSMITRKPLFLSIVYTNVIYKKNGTNLL